VDQRLPGQVIGDAARLRQVLLNLAGNAIKFTEAGGVALIVEPDQRAGHIRFLVRDTGIGLAPEDQARVFRDFEQADGSSTRKFGGTGLGLAISKRIVEHMDGHIAVESKAGGGATFSFTVPLPAAADSAPEFTAPDLAGKVVLIVAAANIESALLARRLGSWGAETCVAADVESTVAHLAKRWDALLVDYPLAHGMIDHGGLARVNAARRIVLIRPTERHELLALKERGFTGYLVKPVRMASLAARLTAEDAFEGMAPETSGNAMAEITEGKGLSILVAEDNEINALLARALLTRLGHRPAVAGNGEAAMESWAAARAAGKPFDLVLMDVQMPGMDGLEAARRIRATETQAGDPPVRMLALTANAQSEDRAACLAAGMDGLLVKPLDRERLREALDAVAARLAA
jgi:CheY-like chemotaxis protein/anti-sigma regulatory factor (Ser/Thr protein kinase)